MYFNVTGGEVKENEMSTCVAVTPVAIVGSGVSRPKFTNVELQVLLGFGLVPLARIPNDVRQGPHQRLQDFNLRTGDKLLQTARC